MPVFKNYQNAMGSSLEKVTDSYKQMLAQRVPNFDMSKFVAMLPHRAKQIDEEIYQILNSLSDFGVFKNLMLDYKTAHEDEVRLKTIKSVKIP